MFYCSIVMLVVCKGVISPHLQMEKLS